MAARAKPFQSATARRACSVLCDTKGTRRFLVADEPGLGKTMVAREIITAFVTDRQKIDSRRPIIVYYITNGLRVAHQNRDRLVAALQETTPQDLVSPAERLSLIPMTPRLHGPVELFALTPATSFPGKATGATGGRVDERAFLMAILKQALPKVADKIPDDHLRRPASAETWKKARWRMEQRAANLSAKFFGLFRQAMCEEFGKALDDFGTLVAQTSVRVLLTGLRRALSHAALLQHPPDLVILDEFQKYREMISIDGRQDRLVRTLYAGVNGMRPAVLLLSGTPYPSVGDDAHLQLFELLAFLKDSPTFSKAVAEDFRNFGALLQAIARAAGNAGLQGELESDARELRDRIQRKMTAVMARTERAMHDAAAPEYNTQHCTAPLLPVDIKAYRALVSLFQPKDRGDALAYWLSVPLPAQALGPRYDAWKRRRDVKLAGPKLDSGAVDGLELPAAWPHPKLRALHKIAPPGSLALPWIAPTLRWWNLRGAWKHRAPEKLLLFSRFKAAPQSIAALTSFSIDATELHAGQRDYRLAVRASRLQPSKPQMPLFALFHPSPFLAAMTDPLAGGISRSLDRVRRKLRSQIRTALRPKVELPDERKPARRSTHRPVWKVLAAIESRFELTREVYDAWSGPAERDASVAKMRESWCAVDPLKAISARELDDLVEMALSAPGVICARALLRHHPGALAPGQLAQLVSLSWNGLRIYLDEPVFWAKWSKGKVVEAVHTLMVDGCFESVLDEHYWMRLPTVEGGSTKLAEDLTRTFQLSAGAFTFQRLEPGGQRSKGIRIRCHAAVPFGGTDDKGYAKRGAKEGLADRPLARSDDLRVAFNTPFWPHILSSTSVGQEGLDFHTWCSRVAHWDLCPTPVELEQREGRVNRYAGLAVRRALAGQLREEVLGAQEGDRISPWAAVERLANQQCSDESGLWPWWQTDGAHISRYVFRLPLGKDELRFAQLQDQRLLYRLALGQPNPEDLIQSLAARDDATLRILRGLVLNLSAYRPEPGARWPGCEAA